MPDMRSARARFFARDGKGFGFGAPAAGCSTDFHDPWRMVVGDGWWWWWWWGGGHRPKLIMPACNMHGPQSYRPELHSCAALSLRAGQSMHAEYIAPNGAALDARRARLHLRLGSSRPPSTQPPIDIHAALTRKRTRHGIATPTLARIRAALRSATHRPPWRNTRGRKRHAALQMGEKRKQQIKPAGGRAGRRRRQWGPRGR